MNAEREEWESRENSKKDQLYWWGTRYTPDPLDLGLVQCLIDLRKNQFNKKSIGMRYEGNSVCVYTNDMNIIDQIVKIKPDVILNEAVIAPQGIKYFKKEPPAKYRAYLTNNKVGIEFREDMLEYLGRTPDVRPSGALRQFLSRTGRINYHNSIWLWSNYFVDYDDERNLMMMHLMFPGAIGKTYKLEKK